MIVRQRYRKVNRFSKVAEDDDRPIELSDCKQISDGIFYTIGNQRRQMLLTYIQGCIIGIIFFGALAYIFYTPADTDNAMFMAMMSVMSLVAAIYFIQKVWPEFLFHPAELVFPSYPLRLGETCSIYYRRRLRKGTFKQEGWVEGYWFCEEWANDGDQHSRYKTYLHHEKFSPIAKVAVGDRTINYSCDIAIPLAGPPSFYTRYNRIRWTLRIKVKAAGISQADTYDFYLKVLPEAVV